MSEQLHGAAADEAPEGGPVQADQPSPGVLPEAAPEEAPGPRPAVPPALVEFMGADWAPTRPLVDGPSPAAPFHQRRRDALAARFEGEWLVVPTGGLKVRANDTDYRFRAGTDFAWLTGCQEPDAVLVIDPQGASTLYKAPRADRSTPAFFADRRYGELWIGPRLGLEDTSVLLEIATAPLDDLDAALKEAAGGPVRVVRGYDAHVDAQVPTAAEEEGDDGTDQVSPDAELLSALSEMRLVKDTHEVTCLDAAVAATVLGFEDVVRSLPTARAHGERWVEGTFN